MVEDLSKKRLAILGLGKMGSILLQPLLKAEAILADKRGRHRPPPGTGQEALR